MFKKLAPSTIMWTVILQVGLICWHFALTEDDDKFAAYYLLMIFGCVQVAAVLSAVLYGPSGKFVDATPSGVFSLMVRAFFESENPKIRRYSRALT